MKGSKYSLATLALAIFVMLWPAFTFAQIEKAVIKIEGAMQCSL